MADTPKAGAPANETPVKKSGLEGFEIARTSIETTDGNIKLQKITSLAPGIVSLDYDITTASGANKSTMHLILDSVLVSRNGKEFSATLPHETAMHIKEAVKAIQASGGVSTMEAELADNLRQVITEAMSRTIPHQMTHDNEFSKADLNNIEQATALLRASANLPKGGWEK